MRAVRSVFVLTPFIFVVAAGVERPVSAKGGRGRLGKHLEGLTLDQRKAFRDGKEAFETAETAAEGLGPIFNGVSCVACHFMPAVGGASPINETRAQQVDPTSGIHSELPGGSLFQSQAISPACQETVPTGTGIVSALRQTTPLFGLGLVEAIPDAQLLGYADQQAAAHPQQAGKVNMVEDVASTPPRRRVGRFGWKAQQATLQAFSGDAYVNEMGITSTLFPNENAPNGNPATLRSCDTVVPEPEDQDDDVTAFATFMRLLAPPPRDDDDEPSWRHLSRRRELSPADRGRSVFEKIGCEVCHHAGFTAVSRIEAINGSKVDAFSDFLLHDVGTGDGIIQPPAGANELRTPPLWGISESAPYLHDGSAATIPDAIARHANQGAAAQQAFAALSDPERRALLAFLDSI